jgi:hypothetical protein
MVWLKHVPAFFSHEGVILRRFAGGPVPSLLGHDGGRILMPEIPGEDYDAPARVLWELVRILSGYNRLVGGLTSSRRSVCPIGGSGRWRRRR